jgi:hypothetical protein
VTGRVLVTARCRHKGHVLAELLITGGRRAAVVRGRGDPRGALADAAGEIARLDQGEGLGGEGASHRVTCACGRPHLVREADLETARVAGEPVVIIDPMR